MESSRNENEALEQAENDLNLAKQALEDARDEHKKAEELIAIAAKQMKPDRKLDATQVERIVQARIHFILAKSNHAEAEIKLNDLKAERENIKNGVSQDIILLKKSQSDSRHKSRLEAIQLEIEKILDNGANEVLEQIYKTGEDYDFQQRLKMIQEQEGYISDDDQFVSAPNVPPASNQTQAKPIEPNVEVAETQQPESAPEPAPESIRTRMQSQVDPSSTEVSEQTSNQWTFASPRASSRATSTKVTPVTPPPYPPSLSTREKLNKMRDLITAHEKDIQPEKNKKFGLFKRKAQLDKTVSLIKYTLTSLKNLNDESILDITKDQLTAYTSSNSVNATKINALIEAMRAIVNNQPAETLSNPKKPGRT